MPALEEETTVPARSAGRSMASGGALSLVRLGTGLVRTKVVALALGVSGVGIYAIIAQLYLVGVSLAAMSLSTGIINSGRRSLVDGDTAETGRVAGTALALVLVNCLLLAVIAAGLGDRFFTTLGVGEDVHGLLLPIGIAVLFGAVSGAFWEGLSFLCDRFDAYVRVCMAAAVADMLFIAAGAWLFGLRGAIIALPLGPLTMFVAYAIWLGRDPRVKAVIANLSVSTAKLPRLLSFSITVLGAVALTNIGLTFLRSQVMIEGGEAANGYLQTVTSLAAYILAFVMTGFWGHLYARTAAAGDVPEVRAELDRTVRLGLLITFTGCGSAAVLADYLIPLFYSRDFAAAAELLIAYMPGEFCFQLLSMLIAYQITVSLRRRYLMWSLGYVGLLVAIGTAMIPVWSALGYVAAHVVASAAMLLIVGFITVRSGQISARTALHSASLLAVLTAVSAALLYLRSEGYGGSIGLVMIIPFAISGAILLRRIASELPIPWRRAS